MNEINSKNYENMCSLINGNKNNNEETMKDSLSIAKNYNQKSSVNKEIKEIKKIIIIVIILKMENKMNHKIM